MERLSESAALLESGNADASDAASSLEASPSRSNFLYTVGKATVASFAVAGVVLLGTLGSRKKPPSSRTSSLVESPSLAKASSFSLADSSTTLSVTLQPFNDDFHYGRMQQTIASYPSMGLSNLVEPMKPTTFGVAFDDVTIGEKVQKGELVCSYSVQSMLLGSDTVTPWDSGNTVPQSSYIETGELGAITLPDGENRDMATVGLSASFPSPGRYTLSLECRADGSGDGDGNGAGAEETARLKATEKIEAYYVRRELRELSDRERNDFLDAFDVLRSVPTKEGVRKYGPGYKSLEDFEVMHVAGAGQRNLDHMHDGMGISTQHTAMTSEFEQALQAVNMKVSVPYWDYTVDSARVEVNGVRPESFRDIFRESELFTAVWFGNTEGTEHKIADGRFAGQTVPRDYEFKVRSPYGFLRAPWNLNPSEYVTRYHKFCGADPAAHVTDSIRDTREQFPWPTCADHFMMTNTDNYTTWYDWEMEIGYKPHGPVHSWIGGVGGECETTWDAMHRGGVLTTIQLQKMKHNAFIMLKNLWREELLETPKYCSADTPVKECMWVGVDNFVDHPKVQDYMKALFAIGKETPNFKEVIRRAMLETAFWPGDHLEAGSPAEASFWPIHPTIDRLIQYRDQVRPFTDMSWANISSDSTCNYGETDCKGHNAYDTTYFQATVWDEYNKVYVRKHLTNVEMRNSINPTEKFYRMSYLYNHFEWAHCSELGVDFAKISASPIVLT
jgi:hypothetical protein